MWTYEKNLLNRDPTERERAAIKVDGSNMKYKAIKNTKTGKALALLRITVEMFKVHGRDGHGPVPCIVNHIIQGNISPSD